jgi:hypothetical protein
MEEEQEQAWVLFILLGIILNKEGISCSCFGLLKSTSLYNKRLCLQFG